jgi:Ni/Co efflux regulator RcnB
LEAQQRSVDAAIRLKQEAEAALDNSLAYTELKRAKDDSLGSLQNESAGYAAQIAALNKLKDSLGAVTVTGTTASKAASSAAKAASSASKQEKTQAEQDLASFKALKAELDHQRSMDEVTEKEYYQKLAEYRDQYLTDGDNLDEYRQIDEKIYNYDKSLAEAEDELWEEATEKLTDELESRLEAIQDAQSKMAERLADYGDLFSIQDDTISLGNLQDQIDAINAYDEALSALKDKGLSDGLMDQVLSMDVDEATAYAQQLLEMTDEQWDEYNALWEEKQQRAAEVAAKFYADQLDALQTEYNDKLGTALGELTDTAYTSGVDTVQGLIEGLASMESALYAKAQAMADAVASILSSATATETEVDGSHAGGLAYVPYDGYIAKLHQGERVLTAAEARDYIAAAMPTTYEPAAQTDTTQKIGDMLSQAVNAVGAVGGYGASNPVIKLQMNVNGREFYQETVGDLRSIMKSSPEAVDD